MPSWSSRCPLITGQWRLGKGPALLDVNKSDFRQCCTTLTLYTYKETVDWNNSPPCAVQRPAPTVQAWKQTAAGQPQRKQNN